MKTLLLALLLITAPLAAHARNFLAGTMSLEISYATLMGGSHEVLYFPQIAIHASDDERFCELTLDGANYPCKYVSPDRFYQEGQLACDGKPLPGDEDKLMDYNCTRAAAIAIPTDAMLKLLSTRHLPGSLAANLRAKLLENAKNGTPHAYPDTFATLAYLGDLRDVRSQLLRSQFDVSAADDEINHGQQIHDDRNPDSFHFRAKMTTQLTQF